MKAHHSVTKIVVCIQNSALPEGTLRVLLMLASVQLKNLMHPSVFRVWHSVSVSTNSLLFCAMFCAWGRQCQYIWWKCDCCSMGILALKCCLIRQTAVPLVFGATSSENHVTDTRWNFTLLFVWIHLKMSPLMHGIAVIKAQYLIFLATWRQQKQALNTTLTYRHLLSSYSLNKQLLINASSCYGATYSSIWTT